MIFFSTFVVQKFMGVIAQPLPLPLQNKMVHPLAKSAVIVFLDCQLFNTLIQSFNS